MSKALHVSEDAGGATTQISTLRDLLTMLPKVELHAHLNGCIRESTLSHLARERGVLLNMHHFAKEEHAGPDDSMYNMRPRSLGDCFEIFAEIAKCVDDLPSLSRVTTEALEDFAAQHVAYLELRSTPKLLLLQTGQSVMATKRDYCRTVIDCMKHFEQKEAARFEAQLAQGEKLPRLPMVCRFIIAIDRSQSSDEATEHVCLAETLRSESCDCVVGVDLGGNPTKYHFHNFQHAFQRARQAGLKITLHCGEVPCEEKESLLKSDTYAEAKSILDFAPERLGHALLLPPSLQKVLLERKIPVESCPTSNVMTLELAKHHSGSLLEGLKNHPQMEKWLVQHHPLSIGTDDPGVFNTNATKELMLIQKAFDLDTESLAKIPLEAMEHAFCDGGTSKNVAERIEERITYVLSSI